MCEAGTGVKPVIVKRTSLCIILFLYLKEGILPCITCRSSVRPVMHGFMAEKARRLPEKRNSGFVSGTSRSMSQVYLLPPGFGMYKGMSDAEESTRQIILSWHLQSSGSFHNYSLSGHLQCPSPLRIHVNPSDYLVPYRPKCTGDHLIGSGRL